MQRTSKFRQVLTHWQGGSQSQEGSAVPSWTMPLVRPLHHGVDVGALQGPARGVQVRADARCQELWLPLQDRDAPRLGKWLERSEEDQEECLGDSWRATGRALKTGRSGYGMRPRAPSNVCFNVESYGCPTPTADARNTSLPQGLGLPTMAKSYSTSTQTTRTHSCFVSGSVVISIGRFTCPAVGFTVY